LLSSRQERQFDLCDSRDGVGSWGVSCITDISRPDGSFVRGFLFALLFGILVLKFLLLLFDFYGVQHEGEVLQMYMMLQV